MRASSKSGAKPANGEGLKKPSRVTARFSYLQVRVDLRGFAMVTLQDAVEFLRLNILTICEFVEEDHVPLLQALEEPFDL